MAVSKGYTVQRIYEVYHFTQRTRYNREENKGGLFAQYINCWLRIKQQASGWPPWCKTASDREKYISDYYKHEGIKLDKKAIPENGKNAGLRYLAKLFLNSFWGKFGQRLSLSQSTFFNGNETKGFIELLGDRRKSLKDFRIAAGNVLLVQWEYVDKFIPENYNTNIFVACLTTCLARLKLYKALAFVGKLALYADTDSIIYIKKEGGPQIPIGDMLGDFTDELDGQEIEEFVSGGCKQYAYRTKDKKEECKVRGFTLNFANSKVINFGSLKNLVFGEVQSVCTTNSAKIMRHKGSCRVYNKPQVKTYTVVNDKRVIDKTTMTTLPYGH